MNKLNDHRKGYTAAFLLGAASGGLLLALSTRAIPRMMSRLMSKMMQEMMSHMSENDCDPAEM